MLGASIAIQIATVPSAKSAGSPLRKLLLMRWERNGMGIASLAW